MFIKEDGVYRQVDEGGSHSYFVDKLVYSKEKYPVKYAMAAKLIELKELIEKDETLDTKTRDAIKLQGKLK